MHVIFETKCNLLVDNIDHGTFENNYTECGILIDHIREILAGLLLFIVQHNLKLQFIGREANGVAHLLARSSNVNSSLVYFPLYSSIY